MKTQNKANSGLQKSALLKGSLLLGASISMLTMAPTAFAQDAGEDVVIATGIRQSLENALIQKRNADSLIEVIVADDIGKLPDQNLAEVLENITGVQITRTAGVGTNVQIRGTDDNRTEINGVSTVGSGSGRSGINFEDINASIISSVEVTKSPEAATIEGSVGGTINLKTIRPLELKKTLASVRIQGEDSNLSTSGIQPRVSGALGKKWENAKGQEIGIVLSGSYTEQEAVSFRPRVDRDNIGRPAGADPAEFLGIQFLVQEQENFDFETINFSGSIEARPTQNLKLYLDGFINEQERSQDSYRLQASGVSSFINSTIPTSFETVDFGVGPGEFPAALTGSIVRNGVNDDNPNLRFSSDTGARVTDTDIIRIGGEWEKDRFSARAEFASSGSETVNPNLSTTLNFINPNTNLVARVQVAGDNDTRTNVGLVGDIQTLEDAIASVPGTDSGLIFNDNSTPFIFDLTDDQLSFGIDFDAVGAPTAAQLLDPNNVVLDQVQVGRNTTVNDEDAFRLDLSYDLGDATPFLKSVDVGYRYNESSSVFEDIDDNIGGFTALADSPNGSLFADLLVAGPDNFDDADGRDLFISNFLLIDPDLAFSDPQQVIDTLQAAVVAHDPGSPDILNLQSDQNAFFDVSEETHSIYGQVNFEQGIFSGNIGVRYVDTEIESVAFSPSLPGVERTLVTTPGSYDFFLPRINVAVRPTEDILIRGGYTSDIRRPDFSNLNTSFSFDQSENFAVSLGNPGLEPEEVDSFDISADWYFAPSSVISIGYFNKKRTNIFGTDFEGALVLENQPTTSGQARETDPSCPGGGIFNPIAVANVLGAAGDVGLCADFSQPGNASESTTQEGIEVAFQYDLSGLEDSLGNFDWASGFGVLANYTYQTFSGGSDVDTTSGRGLTVLGDVSIPRGLLDFSPNAFNLTGYYEKFGLSVRARYTWRDSFRTQDFGGGANTSGSSTFSFPVTTLARGQLNASVNYDVTDNFTIGVEAVNLTESRIIQRCVSEDGPTCFVGFPDRRVIFGGSYTF